MSIVLDTQERARLRAQAQKLHAQMQIGKSGITDGVVEETNRQLEDHRLVKVKMLPSTEGEGDAATLARELAERTGAALVEVRGRTVVLWKPRGGRARAGAGGGAGGDPPAPSGAPDA